jgi:hypothetical protein
MFWNIVIGIASFLLNLLLMPKPQDKVPASLEDFDIPVAEEGIEIPVVFGTVNIKSPKVVWYGDLFIQEMLGERRYGFFGPKQKIGFRYALGMHFVLCHGCHDEIREIWAGEKLIFPKAPSTEVAEGSTSIFIDQYDIFGGDDREGGIGGTVIIKSGGPNQSVVSYLEEHMGAGVNTPAFRGVVSVIWSRLYIGNSPYIKPWEFVLKRIHLTSRGNTQWYDAKAAVPDSLTASPLVELDMNPAHIIRECLTDRTWGMGYNASDMDDDSFTAAADTLYNECFGLSLQWTREERIEEFITTVISCIDAYLYLRRDTGKFYLKLIRNDYDINTIPQFDEDDVIMWEEIQWRQPSEAVGTVVVKYVDRRSRGRDASTSVDNIAQIQQIGERISVMRHYPGVSRLGLANKLSSRDQKPLSIGMISGRVQGKRTFDVLYPGDPFRLTSARYNLEGQVMRVAQMKFGDGRANKVGVKFIQDVFKLGAAELVDDSDSDWENPINPPSIVEPRLVWEMPYREMIKLVGPGDTSSILTGDPDTGLLEMAGGRPSSDSSDALVYVDGSQVDIMGFAPAGLLSMDIARFDTIIVLDEGVDLTSIEIGLLAAITPTDQDPTQTEIVRIESIAGTYVIVSRGMLDTVPRAHNEGDWLIVFDDFATTDSQYRTVSNVSVTELLTRTGLGSLTQALAPDDTVVMNTRAIRPLRPANIVVEGMTNGPIPDVIGTVDVSWSERNRLTEIGTVLSSWMDATEDPEDGQTTIIEIYDSTNTTIVDTISGLTGTSTNVPTGSFSGGSGWLHIGSERDGYREWQAFEIEVYLSGGPQSLTPSHYTDSDMFHSPTVA